MMDDPEWANVLAPEVQQHGGDDQLFLQHKQQQN
jgi:hypothetical protein